MKVTVGDDAACFACLDCDYADDGLGEESSDRIDDQEQTRSYLNS